ncbi:MAG: T9SS type A sorting domain-containing protein, partial [Bacteroidota bacterium]
FLGTSTGWKPSPWPAGSPLGLDLLASGVFPALAPVRSETQSRDDILAGLPYGGVMLFEPSSRAVSTDPALPEAQRLFFAAYPNPTGRELHVETSTQLRLTLYDVLGRRVDQWLMDRFRIELQLNVPPGLYFLHGEAKDGKQQTISFVVGSS